jgi:hypothetical protein
MEKALLFFQLKKRDFMKIKKMVSDKFICQLFLDPDTQLTFL